MSQAVKFQVDSRGRIVDMQLFTKEHMVINWSLLVLFWETGPCIMIIKKPILIRSKHAV